jgi:hypothetical protein
MRSLRVLPRSSVGNVSSCFCSPFSIFVKWVFVFQHKEVTLCDYVHFLDEIMAGMCLICALLVAFIQFLP